MDYLVHYDSIVKRQIENNRLFFNGFNGLDLKSVNQKDDITKANITGANSLIGKEGYQGIIINTIKTNFESVLETAVLSGEEIDKNPNIVLIGDRSINECFIREYGVVCINTKNGYLRDNNSQDLKKIMQEMIEEANLSKDSLPVHPDIIDNLH